MNNIDKYDPQIYPRKLYVAVEADNLQNYFSVFTVDGSKKLNDEEFKEELSDSTIAMSTYSVMDKENLLYGALVYIPEIDRIKDTDIPHESVHVADYIFQDLGINIENFTIGNEAYAYLVGWIAGCISKSIIKFKKDKENDSRRK